MRALVPGFAALLTAVIVTTASAHEHMYIGSDRPKGGALVLRYDFTRAFPLVTAPSGNGFIGTDPAFNAQVTDDPSTGIYRLKPGTVVRVQLMGADPGVSVDMNGAKLTAPGDTAKVGRMPYLHQHPQWLLQAPSGVTGTFRLSFRVLAAGYKPSIVYGALMSNVAEPTTTTTTLPGQTCAPGSCNDGDGCTIDSCVGGACRNDPATGIDAVRCRMAPLSNMLDSVRPATARGRRSVQRLYKAFNSVGPALDALTAGGAGAKRLLGRATRSLNHFAALVDRSARVQGVDPAQADALRRLAGNVYDQLVLLSP